MISSSGKMLLHFGFVFLATACGTPPASQAPDPVVRTDNSRVGDYDAATNSGCLGCGLQNFKYIVLEPVSISAPPDSAFVLLRSIYKKFGVDVMAVNPTTGEIGNRQFNRTSKLGGVFLHEYVNCGQSLTGPTADTYRIQLTLMSYVTPSSSGAIVKSQLTARAYDTGAGQGSTQCESTGVLEERIKRELTAAAPQRAAR